MKIMKGWEPFSFKKSSKTGVLVLQGFTGSTSSVYPLASDLARAGYSVEGPRLAGHGTRWSELNSVRCEEWILDAEEGLKKLKKRVRQVFVAGLSMGGTLALHLAARHSEIRGIILVNHSLLVHNKFMYLAPLLKLFIPSVPPISSDIRDPLKKETAYDRTPVGGVHQLVRLLRSVKKELPLVKQPCLIFKSRQDHVLPAKNAHYTMKHIGSKRKELVWLENSYHVATMDYDKELIAKKSVEFIRKNLKSS